MGDLFFVHVCRPLRSHEPLPTGFTFEGLSKRCDHCHVDLPSNPLPGSVAACITNTAVMAGLISPKPRSHCGKLSGAVSRINYAWIRSIHFASETNPAAIKKRKMENTRKHGPAARRPRPLRQWLLGCLLWLKARHSTMSASCLLHPDKRALIIGLQVCPGPEGDRRIGRVFPRAARGFSLGT